MARRVTGIAGRVRQLRANYTPGQRVAVAHPLAGTPSRIHDGVYLGATIGGRCRILIHHAGRKLIVITDPDHVHGAPR